MKYLNKNEEAVTPVLAVILLVAITVIVAVIIAVFMFGVGAPEEAPQAKLAFSSNTTVLNIRHAGGDPLIKSDTLVTLVDAETDTTVFGPTAIGSSGLLMPGNTTDVPYGLTISADKMYWVQVLDSPSGQFVANTKIVVFA